MTPTTVTPVALPERTFRDLRNAGSKTREWTARRDELIRQAHNDGGGVREIARAVGLTHPSVLRILHKDRDGEFRSPPLRNEDRL